MTTILYKSTDTGAPVLSGQFGALTNLLDACLVNGYGAKLGAGWTIAFTALNTRAYRMNPTASTGYYLRVEDCNSSRNTNPQDALFTGFKSMTNIDTGAGQFPTYTQQPLFTGGVGGLIARKSATTSTTPRPWVLVADGSTFYLFIETDDTLSECRAVAFGDFVSTCATDADNCMIIGRTQIGASASYEFFGAIVNSYPFTSTSPGHYLADIWTGISGSMPFGVIADYGKGAQSPAMGGTSQLTYPNQPDNGLLISPLQIIHNGALRGHLKGLWNPLTFRPVMHGDTFTGTGDLTGKSMLAQYVCCQGSQGEVIVETSDTWG